MLLPLAVGILSGLAAFLAGWFLFAKKGPEGSGFDGAFRDLLKQQERLEKVFKDEISRNREETNVNERAAREEMGRQISSLVQSNEKKLEALREALERQLRSIQDDNGQKLEQMRMV